MSPNKALEADAEERGRRLFSLPVRFVLGAVDIAQLPHSGTPEIAFAGRSNVGKSSLINLLTGARGLARTSNTPGRTQELNVFDLGGVLRMVDMPGYGFAKAPKAKVAAWQRLVRTYLRGRRDLLRAFLLIDARHGVLTADRDMLGLLNEAAVAFQIVLTKADKVGPVDLARVRQEVRVRASKLAAALPAVLATSSETGAGIAELRAEIASLLG